jgi:hypothetical protein
MLRILALLLCVGAVMPSCRRCASIKGISNLSRLNFHSTSLKQRKVQTG